MAKLLWQTGVLLSNFIRPAFLKNKLCRYVIKNAKLAVNNLREYILLWSVYYSKVQGYII